MISSSAATITEKSNSKRAVLAALLFFLWPQRGEKETT